MADTQQRQRTPLSRGNSHTKSISQPKAETVSLNSLAAKISSLSAELTTYLEANRIPAPTFAADSPTSYAGLSHEMFMTRQVLLDAIQDMWYLAQGPSESVFNYAHCVRAIAPEHHVC